MDESRLHKFLVGALTGEEFKALYDWVKGNDANRRTFSNLKNTWVFSRSRGKMPEAELQQEYIRFITRRESREDPEEATLTTPQYTIGYYLLRIAAVLLLVYGTGITYFHLQNRNTETYHEIYTRRGEKSMLLLSDSTRIWINSDSHVRYPTNMNKKNVVVYLEGEAYFDVSKVKGRKFVVHTSDLDITALGTSFNVKSYKEEGLVETTLEEGKILITGEKRTDKLKRPLIMLPNQRVTIYTGSEKKQQAMVDQTHPAMDEKQPADGPVAQDARQDILIQHQPNTAIYTSWKDGNLQFRKERFEDLAVLLERWYDVKIIINDVEIREWQYTGTFDKETIEQALIALSLSMPFRYTIQKNSITIEK